jgi:hypothetical protein
MNVSEAEHALFSADRYLSPHARIPQLMGAAPNAFSAETQYVKLTAAAGFPYYRPAGSSVGYDANEYATGTEYEDDFKHWVPASDKLSARQEYVGYLAGFPEITKPWGDRELTIHMWFFNASILDDTIAVPLVAVKSLYKYSSFRRSLVVDLDEMSMGDTESMHEITVRNVRTNVSQTRWAVGEDLQHLIAMSEKLEKPELVYPEDERQIYGRQPRGWANSRIVDVQTELI